MGSATWRPDRGSRAQGEQGLGKPARLSWSLRRRVSGPGLQHSAVDRALLSISPRFKSCLYHLLPGKPRTCCLSVSVPLGKGHFQFPLTGKPPSYLLLAPHLLRDQIVGCMSITRDSQIPSPGGTFVLGRQLASCEQHGSSLFFQSQCLLGNAGGCRYFCNNNNPSLVRHTLQFPACFGSSGPSTPRSTEEDP